MEIPQERQIHNHAMNYENYLSRAFKYDLNINRAHKQEFINLVNAELGKKMSFLPNYDTQLENVINRLNLATEIFISKSKDNHQIKFLEDLQKEILSINSYKSIPEIVLRGIELTKNFI